jgi:hypothetical protein
MKITLENIVGQTVKDKAGNKWKIESDSKSCFRVTEMATGRKGTSFHLGDTVFANVDGSLDVDFDKEVVNDR